jgi:hypothetical protein
LISEEKRKEKVEEGVFFFGLPHFLVPLDCFHLKSTPYEVFPPKSKTLPGGLRYTDSPHVKAGYLAWSLDELCAEYFVILTISINFGRFFP